jgi:glycerate 2-kinase
VKGGRLARIAYPATLVSLVLSDVIGNQLDVVGSGPTAPDRSTFADCLNVLSQYRIERDFPPAALAFLQRGATGGFEETPKNGSPVFRNVQNLIVGDYNLAVAGAKKQAEALGYHSFIVEPPFVGEARKIALAHTALAKNFLTDRSVSRPLCAVSGGETTVTVRGDGVGGRNQELGLTAAIEIDGQDGIVILSGGTDGTDGPTDAAGAIVDGTTLARARAKGLDAAEFLRRNDAYPFLQSVGDLLVTGPTRTNVVDLCVILVV